MFSFLFAGKNKSVSNSEKPTSSEDESEDDDSEESKSEENSNNDKDNNSDIKNHSGAGKDRDDNYETGNSNEDAVSDDDYIDSKDLLPASPKKGILVAHSNDKKAMAILHKRIKCVMNSGNKRAVSEIFWNEEQGRGILHSHWTIWIKEMTHNF